MTNSSTALALGYGIAIAGWAALLIAWPGLWPKQPLSFERPWREVLWAFAGVLGVILVGQAYVAGFRLRGTGGLRVVAESVNQLVIFAPMLAIPILRGHDLTTAWIRRDRIWLRLAIGTALSIAAVGVFTALHGPTRWPAAVAEIYRPRNAHIAVQVLLEDIAIAILVVRLAAALGKGRAVALAGILFAAGHVPTMIAVGVSVAELAALLRDAALAIAVISLAIRAADVWVLWPMHFAMDMMQYVTSGRTP
jgi:hypothetical protein